MYVQLLFTKLCSHVATRANKLALNNSCVYLHTCASGSLCVFVCVCCASVQYNHSQINPTILDNMRPGRVKFGSPLSFPLQEDEEEGKNRN